MNKEYVDVQGAIAYLKAEHDLKYTKGSLAVYRSTGKGASFIKANGRVFYLIDELDTWAAHVRPISNMKRVGSIGEHGKRYVMVDTE